jgi:uncharacterized protein (TIGR03435 family)
MRDVLVAVVVLGLAWIQGVAAASPQEFDSADIRVSAPNTLPGMRRTFTRGRYELRDATVLDLIQAAWDVPTQNIDGGPAWLDTERFDVSASTRADASPDELKVMLRKLLADRFDLKLRSRSVAVFAYALTLGPRALFSRARGDDAPGCELKSSAQLPNPPGFTQPAVTLVCRNTSASAFARELPTLREASGYLFGYPVVDRTGLAGAWDFRLSWTSRNAWHPDPLTVDGTTISDALDKQLGLRLAPTRIPDVVMTVERVNTPATQSLPRAPVRFESAEIHADEPHAQALACGHIAIEPGGRVLLDMTVRQMILETQGDLNSHRIGGETSTIDAPCWQIQAQAPLRDDAVRGRDGALWNGVDIDAMRSMLRALLAERFKLSAHTEDQLLDGFALLAANPVLRSAAASNRSGCGEGPGANGTQPEWQDPRLANPLASRLVTCRNVTLGQFVRQLNQLMPGLEGPMMDRTGMTGRFDIQINFSPDTTATRGRSGVIPFSQALKQQLGLQLQPARVPAPVLVIDHIAEEPTA